jgi:hypothetical protein
MKKAILYLFLFVVAGLLTGCVFLARVEERDVVRYKMFNFYDPDENNSLFAFYEGDADAGDTVSLIQLYSRRKKN